MKIGVKAIAALVLLSTPAVAQTIPTTAPRVFDANGRVLGRYLGSRNYDRFLVNFLDGEGTYCIDQRGILDGDSTTQSLGATLFYSTANCTGTPYIEINGVPTSGYYDAYPKTATPGYSLSGTIYYAKRPYRTVTVRSSTYTADPVRGKCYPIAKPQAKLVGTIGNGGRLFGIKLPLSVR